MCLQLSLFAQKETKDVKKYKEEADAMRKEVWSWNMPAFKVRTIPEKFANSSSVIVARHVEIVADSKNKGRFHGSDFRLIKMSEVTRELVKINDKSAVAEYSEFGYTQIQKEFTSMGKDVRIVFLGVRVIKSDGTVKEIEADDIVLTKDEKNEKEAKAAIPNLEVGDMIDYFIAKRTNTILSSLPSYTFALYDNSPIIYYSVHCDLGSQYAVDYRCYNGAPDFKFSKGEGDGNVLDLVKENIPAYTETNFWVSPYRQLPIIRLNINIGTNGVAAKRADNNLPGKIYKDQDVEKFIEDEFDNIGLLKWNVRNTKFAYAKMKDGTDSYYKKLKKDKTIANDSLLAAIYYVYRFDKFLSFNAGYDLKKVINYAQIPMDGSGHAFYLHLMMKLEDKENDLILLASKYAPAMKEIMSTGEIAYMLKATGGNSKIFGMEDIFSPAFFIPSYFENTKKAITLDTRGVLEQKSKNFKRSEINIPSSTADQNIRIEKLEIIPSLTESSVQLKRNTILRGHYKSDVQKELILFEDFYESERKMFGIEKSLVEEFEDSKKTKTYAAELKSAFAEARSKQKDKFISEAKGWFDQEVNDLSNFKINNLGVRHNNPDFSYSSQFSIPGIVKKAGNNFILDIGKLQGSPLKVEENQRKRILDVYAPFARSLKYEMTIQIPEGYTAEGVSNLNKKIDNECGLFSCEATTVGNSVVIKIDKVYKKAFEPVGNWSKLLAFIDAANEWSNTKLLLKKK